MQCYAIIMWLIMDLCSYKHPQANPHAHAHNGAWTPSGTQKHNYVADHTFVPVHMCLHTCVGVRMHDIVNVGVLHGMCVYSWCA